MYKNGTPLYNINLFSRLAFEGLVDMEDVVLDILDFLMYFKRGILAK